MPSPPAPVPQSCGTCSIEFASRNALFAHLRQGCLVTAKPPPSAEVGDAGSRPKRRLVLACGYVGHTF